MIDYIFELAAPKLSAVPPSKHLLNSHERALYRSVTLKRQKQLSALLATVETYPQKRLLITSVECQETGNHKQRLDMQVVDKLFSNLANLQTLAFDPNLAGFSVSQALGTGTQLGKLHPIRLPRVVLWPALVSVLSKIPNLRVLEFGIIRLNNGLDTPLAQIAEISLTWSLYPAPLAAMIDESSIQRIFPSAKIVSVEIRSLRGGDVNDWHLLLLPLKSTLRILKLLKDSYPPKCPISLPQLSNFTSLRHLHLDAPVTFDAVHLLSPKLLVTLSVVIEHLDRDLLKLFQGPLRLPHLQEVAFCYGPIILGDSFDMGEVRKLKNDDYSGVQFVGRLEVTFRNSNRRRNHLF